MGETKQIHIEIVLPCFNPRTGWSDRIIQSFSKIRLLLPGRELGLILVNDGSNPKLDEAELERLRQNIPGIRIENYQANQGKGHALRTGIALTQAPLVIYTDVDFPYTEESLTSLALTLEKKEADVVAGVRDDAYYAKVPAGRKRISKFLRWMLRKFLRLGITDTQCGLKGFNEKGKAVFLQTGIKRFLFDLEFIYLASNDASLKVLPCQVSLKPGVEFSKMSWKVLAGESFSFIRIFFRGLFRRKK